MKKKTLLFLSIVLLSGSTTLFSSCDKDTNSYVDVYVVDENNPNKCCPNAYVKIDIDNSYVKQEGYTDAGGHFKTSFQDPAIFDVYVEYEGGCYGEEYDPAIYKCYRVGTNTVRLKEGETVNVTVQVSSDIIREHRQ